MPRNPPPRDANNAVVPHNHEDITNNDLIIRRVPRQWVVSDKNTGRERLSSMAFEPSDDAYGGISIDIERWIREDGKDPVAFVSQPPFIGSLVLSAGSARAINCVVGWDPIAKSDETPANPFHGEIWGPRTTNGYRVTGAMKKQLLRASSWLVELPGVEIAPDQKKPET